MPSLRRVGAHWHIRFRDKRQAPPEVVVSLAVVDYTERQARTYMADRDADRRAGRWSPWSEVAPPTGPVLLSAVVERYIALKTSAGRRGQRGGWNANNAVDRAYQLRAFVRDVGDRPVVQLTASHVEAFVHAPNIAQATQVGRRTMVSALLRWMRVEGVTDVTAPPPIRQVRRLPAYVTETELEAVCSQHLKADAARPGLKFAPKNRRSRAWMADVFRFAFYNGMRREEIMALRVGAVQLDAGTVQVGDDSFVTKTKTENVIPLVPQAAKVLRPYVEGAPHARRVFDHVDGRKVSNAFREAARIAVPSKPGLHFHSLRHSCAVFWRHQGVALEDIRDLLRHSSITTTEIYDQIAPTNLRERFAAAATRAKRRKLTTSREKRGKPTPSQNAS